MSADRDRWLSEIDLSKVLAMLRGAGVVEAFYKVLPRNANSKNQVYLASDLSQLGKIPSGNVTLHTSTSRKSGKQKAVFRSSVDFHWIRSDGQTRVAPQTKLICYPQYPEVRFSGFLKACEDAPSFLWVKDKRGEEPDRILILGICSDKRVVGITLPPESPAAKEIRASETVHDSYGVLKVLPLARQKEKSGLSMLLAEICRIHRLNWVDAIRLDSKGNPIPCNGTNCAGYTLEAQLGIRPNGYSLPDFRGWEVKARQVSNALNPGSSVVTLFTPEPDSGIYVDDGVSQFISRYGYQDLRGREDRLNFGGIYRAGSLPDKRTGLRLALAGFDLKAGHLDPRGSIQLLDASNNIAAAWSFAKLMDHWKAKHAQAAFVPCQTNPEVRRFRFGNGILLGQEAEFRRFLRAVEQGKVYYDPGIKIEAVSTDKPRTKKRSQFRIKSSDLSELYVRFGSVDACNEESAAQYLESEKSDPSKRR